MRTRGHDEELAVGFLVSEGLIVPADVIGVEVGDPGTTALPENDLVVRLRRAFDASTVAARTFVASASCGICGKASLDDVVLRCDPLAAGPVVASAVLLGLPDALRAGQAVFARTGGLHAAGLFDPWGASCPSARTWDGTTRSTSWSARPPWPASCHCMTGFCLSPAGSASRSSRRPAVAGISFVAAVSAPTDLAVEAAERVGMSLVGFLRGDTFNIYAGRERVVVE